MRGWSTEKNKLLIITVLLGTIITQVTCRINHVPRIGLGCRKRAYTLNISRPWYDLDGIRHPCIGSFRVWSCYGFCDSSEIGDYKMPYKISKHPVCTYSSKRTRFVRMNCPGHPDPEAEVFDATGCKCRRCNSEFESCENLSG